MSHSLQPRLHTSTPPQRNSSSVQRARESQFELLTVADVAALWRSQFHGRRAHVQHYLPRPLRVGPADRHPAVQPINASAVCQCSSPVRCRTRRSPSGRRPRAADDPVSRDASSLQGGAAGSRLPRGAAGPRIASTRGRESRSQMCSSVPSGYGRRVSSGEISNRTPPTGSTPALRPTTVSVRCGLGSATARSLLATLRTTARGRRKTGVREEPLDRPQLGRMFTLCLKKLAGSYFVLIALSRGRFGP